MILFKPLNFFQPDTPSLSKYIPELPASPAGEHSFVHLREMIVVKGSFVSKVVPVNAQTR